MPADVLVIDRGGKVVLLRSVFGAEHRVIWRGGEEIGRGCRLSFIDSKKC